MVGIQSRTNLNGGELERIKKRELKWKNLIQSRTNLNGGEPERIKEGGLKWKNSIQSRTNPKCGELERIESTRERRHTTTGPLNRKGLEPKWLRAGMVSCPLGPSGVATAAEEGGQIPGRAPVLDGRGSNSSGHSQAMAGGSN